MKPRVEEEMKDDDLETRLWRIIDREGPPNLPSDIEEAVTRLINHWRRSGNAD